MTIIVAVSSIPDYIIVKLIVKHDSKIKCKGYTSKCGRCGEVRMHNSWLLHLVLS